MRVLLVTGIFPPDHGGPASYVPAIAKGLQAEGNEIVAVITLSETAQNDDPGYSYRVVRIVRQRWRPMRWLQTVMAIYRLARNADVVYLNGLVLEGIVATKFLRRRAVVVKVVGDLIWEKARNKNATSLDIDAFQTASLSIRWGLLRRLQAWYTSKADRVITPSQYLSKVVQGWGVPLEKLRVVYNAVELPSVSDTQTQPIDIVTVARLVPWKGVAELISIVAGRGWSLRVVGDGPLRHELEAHACKLGANVVFAGHVPKAEIASEIRRGKVFVLNSSYEGLPHIVLEAKAAGVAVIASAAGGTPETIDHGVDGWLVPVADGEALTAMIGQLLGDDALRASVADRAKVVIAERFSFKSMVRETATVLSKARA